MANSVRRMPLLLDVYSQSRKQQEDGFQSKRVYEVCLIALLEIKAVSFVFKCVFLSGFHGLAKSMKAAKHTKLMYLILVSDTLVLHLHDLW